MCIDTTVFTSDMLTRARVLAALLVLATFARAAQPGGIYGCTQANELGTSFLHEFALDG